MAAWLCVAVPRGAHFAARKRARSRLASHSLKPPGDQHVSVYGECISGSADTVPNQLTSNIKVSQARDTAEQQAFLHACQY